MIIRSIEFLGSFSKVSQCPKNDFKEFAFIGRSNVGKSSLINYITNRNSLARVSSTPGKTQLLNYFEINKEWCLVDLPGYGYAKVSKKKRALFDKMIKSYILKRENLNCLFLLIDSRISLQKTDLDFAIFLGEHGIPFCLVFTKIDKLKKQNLKQNLQNIKDGFLEYWEELPQSFLTSAINKIGAEDILKFIETEGLK